jgi:hypothetical protein
MQLIVNFKATAKLANGRAPRLINGCLSSKDWQLGKTLLSSWELSLRVPKMEESQG